MQKTEAVFQKLSIFRQFVLFEIVNIPIMHQGPQLPDSGVFLSLRYTLLQIKVKLDFKKDMIFSPSVMTGIVSTSGLRKKRRKKYCLC